MSNEIYLLDNIQNRARDLQYVSETDAEVNAFIVGRGVQTLTAFTFGEANEISDDVTIDEFNLSYFFHRLAPDKRADMLREYLLENLEQLTVFIVGDIQRDVYAVGLIDGYIVGVKTFAVET